MNTQPVVLYVEDDANSRTVLQLLLQTRMKLPHVTVLADSQDFLARAAALEPRPDIVFLDVHVKPHNGFEMLAMLRGLERYQGVPVVAVTASVMNEEIQQLKTAGFDGCLAKPLDLKTFPETLTQILDGKRIWRIMG